MSAEGMSHRGQTGRSRRFLFAVLAVCCLGLLAVPAGALAKAEKLNKEDFQIFKNCPASEASVCTYGETLSGEFLMGSKTVPITKPVILQGGLKGSAFEPLPLLQPLNGVPGVSAPAGRIRSDRWPGLRRR